MTAEQFTLGRLKVAVPALLKNHQDELVAIMAAIADKTPDEYEAQMNLMTVTRDVLELVTDQEFIAFLSSLMSQEESGSTSESTED